MYMRHGISLNFTSKRHIHGGLWFYTWQNIKDQTFSVSALLSLVWIKVYNTLYILFQIQQYLYFQLIFLLIIMAVIVNIQILFCLNGTVSFFLYYKPHYTLQDQISFIPLDMDRQ